MKYNYQPQSQLEKFGIKVYNLLVENFSQTFFVGGMVRDLLLSKKVTDIDIATSAIPAEIVLLLSAQSIECDETNQRYGVVTAKQGNLRIEVTTFRKDLAGDNRYPKVVFVKSPKIDSFRRDFTVNSLYLSYKTGEVRDFHDGLKDIKKKTLRFIGQPDRRIKEDPLRILRAIRFVLVLGFFIEIETLKSIRKNWRLVETLTSSRKRNEILKIKNAKQKTLMNVVLGEPQVLDRFLK